jgi:hypothetical protein
MDEKEGQDEEEVLDEERSGMRKRKKDPRRKSYGMR